MLFVCVVGAINLLTPELLQHGVPDPELPDTSLFLTVFSLEIFVPIFRFYGNKSKTCRPVFWPYRNL